MARYLSLVLLQLLLPACGADTPAREPAWLQFDVPTLDAGRRPPGRAQILHVPWACDGQGSVRVLGLRGDCGCARLGSLPEQLSGGERGTLRVVLAATRRVGRQRIEIRAYTDGAPPRDVARVCLFATVGPNSEGASASGR